MPKTKILKIDAQVPEIEKIKIAATKIRQGKLVAFPTETVYGLGANALDENAVERIFKAKGRPSDNPLIVHITSVEEIKPLTKRIPLVAKKLIKEFWPGPLTIIFEKSEKVPLNVTAGLDTVAIRMPSNRIAQELIKESKTPIAAPSANSFSKPSPTKAEHVAQDLNNKIEIIIDGGSCEVGLESTVLDITTKIPIILRPGKITKNQLKKIIPDVKIDKEITSTGPTRNIKPRSPGMKYKHYSPKGKIILVEGKKTELETKIKNLLPKYKSKKIAILTSNKNNSYPIKDLFYLGSSLDNIARNLFLSFRECDSKGIEIIFAESVSTTGIGLAIMNRLKKASFLNVK